MGNLVLVVEDHVSARRAFAELLRQYEGDQEHLLLIGVDRQCRLKGWRHVASGATDRVWVDHRVLARRIVEMRCDGVWMGHNHPSGSERPSIEDGLLEARVRELCHVLAVEFHGSVIVPTADRAAVVPRMAALSAPDGRIEEVYQLHPDESWSSGGPESIFDLLERNDDAVLCLDAMRMARDRAGERVVFTAGGVSLLRGGFGMWCFKLRADGYHLRVVAEEWTLSRPQADRSAPVFLDKDRAGRRTRRGLPGSRSDLRALAG